jgi:hypothetical protein
MEIDKTFASLILNAAARYEGAYDREASDAAFTKWKTEYDREKAKGIATLYLPIGPDYAKFQRLSHNQAAELACRDHPTMQEPVFLAIYSCWNEMTAWAAGILDYPMVVIPYDPTEHVKPDFIPRGAGPVFIPESDSICKPRAFVYRARM